MSDGRASSNRVPPYEREATNFDTEGHATMTSDQHTPDRVRVWKKLSPPCEEPWEVVLDRGGVKVTLSWHRTEAEAEAAAEAARQ